MEHATAVEGQRRKEVEREQDEVRVAEPGGNPVERIWEASACGQRDEEHPEHERNEGSERSHPELGARPGNQPLNWATPPKSQRLMPSISMPSRLAWSA